MNEYGSNAPAPPKPLTPEEVTAYLDWFLVELVNKRDNEVLPALARDAALGKIEDGDEETAGRLTENARIARALIKTADARREEAKKPYLEGGRAVDAWKKRYEASVLAALAPIDKLMLDYGNRKAAIEKAKREEIARKAQEEADRKAAEAAAALKKQKDEAAAAQAIHDADVAAQKAETAQREAQAPAASMGGTTGIYGARSAPRTSWGWEVVNFNLVPDEFKTIDEERVKERSKERDPETRKPIAIIPGIAWVEYRTVGTQRTRVS